MERFKRLGSFSCLLFPVCCLLSPSSSPAQITYERTYGGTSSDYGNSVQQTVPDGGYILTGWTRSFGEGWNDFYLIKTDSSGDTLWTRTYGGTDYDYGNSVQETQDGGYILTGWTNSFGAGSSWDVYLIKTDPNGMVLGVEESPESRDKSRGITLSQNYPNPFHSSTVIRYVIPSTNHESRDTKRVTLWVYDISGRLVETLVDEIKEPGVYQVQWNGRAGILPVRSGVYFYRLQVGEFAATRKLIILR